MRLAGGALRARAAHASRASATTGSGCARASTRARGWCSSTARTIRPAPRPSRRTSMRWRALIRDRDIAGALRRGLRARGVRRRAASLGADGTRSWRAQLRGVLLRQDAARDRLRVGYCVAPRAAHRASCARCTSSTPSASPTRCSTRSPAYLAEKPDSGAGAGRLLPGQARPPARARWRAPASCCPPAQGTYFQLLDFSAFAPADDLAFAERLLTEARRRHDPAVAVLRGRRSRCRSCGCASPSRTARSMRRRCA